MSQTIDKKVVEMQFDNYQFEKNAATTMSTLDKLKNSLKFSKSSNGLDGIEKAIKNISFGGMTAGIDAVTTKFKALDVVAFTTIQRMTNAAITAGKNLVKSLSVDNISAGFTKYGQKTSAVATLVAQGYELNTVNEQLERLNWFTDETSYNFTDMVESIAKFTATGQELEPSVTAMEGIATWAALSGQNAAKASSAMYQLSQAMGAGVMRKEDYKSIQTLSMDTAEFRQNALDAAVELGTLKKVGADTYQSLVADSKEGKREFNINEFAENLTRGAWFTSDVMMQVFNKYSSAVGDIYEYAEEKGITASEAMKEMGGTLDEFGVKAFKAAQEARTFQDVIDSVKDAASTAWMNTFELIFGDYEQATKLWTDMANEAYDIFVGPINSLNEILEGALLTKETKSLTWEDITGLHLTTEQGQGLIKMLKSVAREHGVAIDQIIDEEGSFRESLKTGWLSSDIFEEALDKFTGSTTSAVLDVEELKKLVDEVIRGTWGDDWTTRINKMTEAGYSEEQIQLVRDYVNKIHELTEGNWSLKDSVWEAANAELGNAEALASLSDEELKNLGLTDKEIAGLRQLAKQAEETGTPLNELYKSFAEGKTGRELLLESFGNIYEYLKSLAEPIGKAWSAVFGGDASKGISDLIIKFNRFSKSLQLSIRTSTKLKNAFKGFFSVLKILENIFGALGGEIFSVLVKALSDLGGFLLNVGSGFGRYITKVAKAAEESQIFQKIIHTLFAPLRALQSILGKLLDYGGKFIGSVFNKLSARFPEITEKFNKLIDTIANSNTFKKIQELSSKAVKSIMDFLGIKLDGSTIGKQATDIVDSIINSLDALIKNIEKADAFISGNGIEGVFQYIKSKIINGIKSIPGIIHDAIFGVANSGSELVDGLANSINKGAESAGGISGIFKNIGDQIAEGIKSIPQAIHDAILGVDVEADELNGSVSKTVEDAFEPEAMFSGLGESIKTYFKSYFPAVFEESSEGSESILDSIFNAISNTLGGIGISKDGVDITKAFKTITGVLGSVIALKAIKNVKKAAENLGEAFSGFSSVMDKLSGVFKAEAKNIKATALLKQAGAFALVLGALVASVKILGDMKPDNLERGVNAALKLGALVAAVLAVFTILNNNKNTEGAGMSRLADTLGKFSKGISTALKRFATLAGIGIMVAGIGAGMLMLVFTFKMLMDVDWSKSGSAIKAMIGFASGIVIFVGILKHIAGDVSIGLAATIFSFALAIGMLVPAVLILSLLSWDKLVKGLVAVGVLLVTLGQAVKMMASKKTSAKSALIVLALAAALNLLIIPILILSKMKLGSLLKGVGSVVLLINTLSEAVSSMKKLNTSSVLALVVMAAAIYALMIPIKQLASMRLEEVIKGVGGVFLLLQGLSGAMKKMGTNGSAGGALSVIAFSLALNLLVVALMSLAKLKLSELGKGLLGVFVLLTSLTASLSITSKFGDWKVILSMTAMVGALALLLWAISILPVDTALPVLIGLSGLVLVLTVAIVALGNLPPITGLVAALNLIEFIGAVVLGIVGICELLTLIPNIDEVGNMFVKIGEVIGKFIGAIGAGISESLPEIGSNLGAFADNAKSFFDLGSDKLDSVKAVVGMIETLANVAWQDFKTRLLSFGSSGLLETIQTSFVPLAKAINDFATTLGPLDSSKIQSAQAIVDMLKTMSGLSEVKSISFLGLFSVTSTSGLGEFGVGLSLVATGLGQFATTLASENFGAIDDETIKKAKGILNFMVKIQDQTAIENPTFFDCLGLFTGYNSLGQFGDGMGRVGSGLANYVSAVNDIKFNDDQSGKAEKIIKFMADIQDQTAITDPTFFDCLGLFTNYNSLGVFGDGMGKVGEGLAKYVETISTINFKDDQSTKAEKIIEFMADIQDKTAITDPTFFDCLSLFTDYNSLGEFGEGMGKVGSGLANYVSAINGVEFDDTKIGEAEKIIEFMTGIQDKLKVDDPTFFETLEVFANHNDLSDFGEGMATVATGLVTFIASINVLTFNPFSIMAAEQVIRFFSTLNTSLQDASSTKTLFDKLAAFAGHSEIKDFGTGMTYIAGGLASFMTAVEEKGVDKEKLETALSIIETLLSFDIQNANGGNNIGGVGTELVNFGNNIATFAGHVTTAAKDFANWKIGDFTRAKNCLVKINEGVSSLTDLSDEKLGKLESVLSTLGSLNVSELLSSLTSDDNKSSITEAAAGIISSFKDGIQSADASEISNSIVGILRGVISDIFGYFVLFKNAGSSIATNLKSGMTNEATLSSITKSIQGVMKDALQSCAKQKEFNSAGVRNAVNLLAGMASQNGSIGSVFNSAMSTAKSNVDGYSDDLNTSGTTLASEFLKGLKSKNDDIKTALSSAIGPQGTAGTALANLATYILSFKSMGSSYASNLKAGINGGKSLVITAASNLGSSAAAACQAALNASKPPQGATAKSGFTPVDKYIIPAMNNATNLVAKKGSAIGKAAVNSISAAIAQASKLVENGVDVQPTIRPVIDLSEINDGIRVLNGMLGPQNSIGVSGNLLAISSMRAGIQNASNADVIAAINNLQRSLDEHPSNIYNIDGITYDDGSNITSAVKELIKAVRIEKRA